MKAYTKKALKKYRTLYLYLIPAVVLALVFSYLPMVGVLIAFKDNINFIKYSNPLVAFANANWTLEHFAKIFSDPEIYKYILNTLIISTYKIVFLFPLPIFLALMIAELKNKHFSKVIQSLVFLPHFFSWVVITGIYKNMLAVSGPINAIFGTSYNWFAEPGTFRGLVVFMSGWKEVGYSSIVYIAAIMAIDNSMYEAARIEGASKIQQAFRITIPMIASVIVIMLIIRVGYIMDAGFDQIYTMMSSTVRETGEIIGTYIYRISLGENSGNYGLSTAVGLFNSVISLILVVAANRISKKVTSESIW